MGQSLIYGRDFRSSFDAEEVAQEGIGGSVIQSVGLNPGGLPHLRCASSNPSGRVLVPSSTVRRSPRWPCHPKLLESEGWCPRRDWWICDPVRWTQSCGLPHLRCASSNPYTLRHRLLRPACLPIPPPEHRGERGTHERGRALVSTELYLRNCQAVHLGDFFRP